MKSRSFIRGCAFAICLAFFPVGLTSCSKPTPQGEYEEAMTLVQEGQIARGIIKLQELVREHSDDPTAILAYMRLAEYYVSERNITKAIENYAAAKDLVPSSSPDSIQLSQVIFQTLQRANQPEQAMEQLDILAEEIPEGDQMTREWIQLKRAGIEIAIGDEGTVSAALDGLDDLMLESEIASNRGEAREAQANYFRQRQEYELSNSVYQRYMDNFPDDTVNSRIKLAMGVNLYQAEMPEEGWELFSQGANALEIQIEEELEQQRRNQLLAELAQMYRIIEKYDEAEAKLLQIMEENKMQMLAIETQFALGDMYATAGVQNDDDELFNKGLAVFEQIKSENEGNERVTGMAEQAIEVVTTVRERYNEELAAIEAAEAAAESEDSTEPSEEAAEEVAEEEE